MKCNGIEGFYGSDFLDSAGYIEATCLFGAPISPDSAALHPGYRVLLKRSDQFFQ